MTETHYNSEDGSVWEVTKKMLDEYEGNTRDSGLGVINGGNTDIHYSAEKEIYRDGVNVNVTLSSNKEYSADDVENVLEDNDVQTGTSEIRVKDHNGRTRIDLFVQDSEDTHRLARILDGVDKSFREDY